MLLKYHAIKEVLGGTKKSSLSLLGGRRAEGRRGNCGGALIPTHGLLPEKIWDKGG